MVPRFIKQALSGQNLTVYGTAPVAMPYLCFRCNHWLNSWAKDRRHGEVINPGNPEEVSIETPRTYVIEITGAKVESTTFRYRQA